MTIIELTSTDGVSIYIVCEHISSFEAIQKNKGSRLTSGGLFFAEVNESPLQIIALIKNAMS